MTTMKQNVNPSKCGDFVIVIKGAAYFIYAACKKDW